MAFTDPFIRRPVLATVVSLLIVLLGFQAWSKLPLRQYPQMENALITVTTAYPGANAETIQGYITQPLQQSLASADGINYMTSVSRQNLSGLISRMQRDGHVAIAPGGQDRRSRVVTMTESGRRVWHQLALPKIRAASPIAAAM